MRFSALSLPFFAAALGWLGMMLYVLFMRGAALLRGSFLAICAAVLPYIAGTAAASATTDHDVALTIYRLCGTPLPFSGLGVFLFDLALTRRLHRFRWHLLAGVAVALPLAIACAASPLVVAGVWRTPSGIYYMRAGPLMVPFVAFIGVGVLAGSLVARASLHTEPSARRRRQYRGAILAFSIAVLAAIDILLTFEIGWYPLGWIFLTAGAAIALRSLVADDLIRAASVDRRVPLALLYLAVAAAGAWAVARSVPRPTEMALALAGVFLLLRIVVGLALRRGPTPSADSPLQRAFERYAADLRRPHGEPELAAATEELLRIATGATRVGFVLAGPPGRPWRRLERGTARDAPAPPNEVLAYLAEHARVLSRDALVAARLGELREPLERLFDAHEAEAIAPLASRDRVLGLILLGALPGERTLRPEEIDLLERVRERAGAELIYMGLYRETTERIALGKEVELAGAVQEAFVPPASRVAIGRLAVCGRYVPASRCGGDWWSAHALPGGRALVMVGDVTGHGVPAAMVTAAAKGCSDVAVRLMSRESEIDLARLLELMDAAVRRRGGDRLHMTCFASLLDPAAGRVTFANAGHVVPYVLRAKNGASEVDALVARGNPLGSSDRPVYRTHVRPLGPGDLIVWYTDGVTECAAPDRTPFGDQRLQRLLRRLPAALEPEEVRDRLLEEVDAFRAGRPADDDITLVVGHVAPSA